MSNTDIPGDMPLVTFSRTDAGGMGLREYRAEVVLLSQDIEDALSEVFPEEHYGSIGQMALSVIKGNAIGVRAVAPTPDAALVSHNDDVEEAFTRQLAGAVASAVSDVVREQGEKLFSSDSTGGEA